MPYRNEIDALHSRIEFLENENWKLRNERKSAEQDHWTNKKPKESWIKKVLTTQLIDRWMGYLIVFTILFHSSAIGYLGIYNYQQEETIRETAKISCGYWAPRNYRVISGEYIDQRLFCKILPNKTRDNEPVMEFTRR